MNDSRDSRTAGFRNAEKDKLREENDNVNNKSDIENHYKAAEYFAAASKCHKDAAKLHSEGNHEAANQSALRAIGFASLAEDYQVKDTKYHALLD